MNTSDEMIMLAKMLEHEWNGGKIDHARARDLADILLPRHPELNSTLSSVRRRMSKMACR